MTIYINGIATDVQAPLLCDIWYIGKAQQGVLINGMWHIREISWVQNAQLPIAFNLLGLLFQPVLVCHQHLFQ